MIEGTGIDIVEISRIKRMIDKWGDKFIQRVFTPEEIQYAQSSTKSSERFAVRFAVKEAIYKAIGSDRTLGWQDIQISHDTSGRPICSIKRSDFSKNILISLSHSKNYAVAHAIITS